MSLQRRANEVLAAATSEDQASSSNDLLERGQQIARNINEAAALIVRAANLREELGFDRPTIDPKSLKQALSRLETDLAKSAVKAVDFKSAGNAQAEAQKLTRQLEQWALRAWQYDVARAIAVIDAADSPELHGRRTTLSKIQTARQRLQYATRLNPLTQRDELESSLDASGVVEARDLVLRRAEALEALLVELKSEDKELSETVRAALKAAGSDEGLPLSAVTRELLNELVEAGVIDGLTVRLA
jgi:hypothetical protein